EGGFTGYGTVFRIDPLGALTTLHTFINTDGAYPYGGLVAASDGFFYGTTAYGGFGGSGTVFRIDLSGALTWVHSFTGADGANPYSSLLQRSDGFFYGTTSGGGASSHGTLYRIDATGILRTEHAFSWAGGATPYAGVTEGRDGFLYGTTQEGGSHNVGTLFRVAFRVATQLAAAPATGVYGGTTTLSATLTAASSPVPGGEVGFTLNGSPAGTATTNASGVATVSGVNLVGLSPGTYTGAVTATFAGDDLYAPSAASSDLIVEKLTPLVTWPTPAAIVYGTALDSTQLNATANVPGDFFYSPPAGTILPVGSGQVLTAQFVPADSALYASVIAHVLIDVTSAEPPTESSFETIHTFVSSDGATPYAGLIQANDGFFYGSTYGGGVGYGTVYRMDASGAVTTLHAFTGADGAYPFAPLVQASDGLLYGTTSQGGP